jgi:(2Fe-2S) ferredoxin
LTGEGAVSEDRARLAEIAAKLRIGGYHRHVFLCIGGTCCPSKAGEEAWEALKKELKDRGLTPGTDARAVYRTKVGCLRVCTDGPIMVVYPDGTYYCGMTADRIPEFVQRHLIDGQPVEEWVFARNPLPPSADASA